VVTAAHVVKGALGAFIESRYEIGVQRDLELIYYDEESDIAILDSGYKDREHKAYQVTSSKA
jgi:S1-C subfamily serine protease